MMSSSAQMLLSIAILLILSQFSLVDSVHSGFLSTKISSCTNAPPKFISKRHVIFKLRAGEAILLGKKKKQKPTFVYMIKAFFR